MDGRIFLGWMVGQVFGLCVGIAIIELRDWLADRKAKRAK